MGFRGHGFSSCSSWALEHRINICGTRAELLHSLWFLPRSGISPVSPTLVGKFFTTEPPGKHKSASWSEIFYPESKKESSTFALGSWLVRLYPRISTDISPSPIPWKKLRKKLRQERRRENSRDIKAMSPVPEVANLWTSCTSPVLGTPCIPSINPPPLIFSRPTFLI